MNVGDQFGKDEVSLATYSRLVRV